VIDLRTVAEAAEIYTERRDADPIIHSKDFGAQSDFHRSVKRECWMFGGNRTGKSHSLAKMIASFARFGHLNYDDCYKLAPKGPVAILVVSVTHDQSRNVMQPKIFNNGAGVAEVPFIPDCEIENFNKTEQNLRLKNGSIIYFRSCQSGPEHFAGYQVDLAAFDEPPDEHVYSECVIRVAAGRRLWIRGAATILPPPGVPGGIVWMYSKKIAPWKDKGGNEANPNLDIFTMSVYDNPLILEGELRGMEEQFPPGSPEYLIRMKGVLLPSIGGTLVYTPFMRSYHVDHQLGPKNINQNLPLCLSTDFNAADGVWTINQKWQNEYVTLDEIHLERSDIASMVYEFRSRYPTHGAELWIYGDATGRRRDGQTGEANFYLIQEYLEGYPVPIRFNLPQAGLNPPVSDRVASVNRVLRPADGSRRYRIAAHCTETIKDFEGTKWRLNGTIDKEGGRRSDGADTVGYWLNLEQPVQRKIGPSSRRVTSIARPGGFRRPASRPAGVFPPGVSRMPRGGFGVRR
jgi:phage terminase large subunit-like protein